MTTEELIRQFDRLTEAPDAIPRVRRFILDLAVRGRLLEQDPTDEPAAEILKRIYEEKKRVAKHRGSRPPEPPPEISQSDVPSEIPHNWSWSHLGWISNRIHYGFTASANTSVKDVRLLRITDIQNNQVDWSSVPGCEINPHDVSQYELHKGDILIARTGGTIGKTFLVDHLPVKAVFASYLIRAQPSSELFAAYLKVFFDSSIYWTQLEDGARGAGQPNVNGQTLGRMIVPIPPIAEQRRIVEKVKELAQVCDRLQTQLVLIESLRRRLLDAVLHDAIQNASAFRANHLCQLTC